MKNFPDKKHGGHYQTFYIGKDMDEFVNEVRNEAQECLKKESTILNFQTFIFKLLEAFPKVKKNS